MQSLASWMSLAVLLVAGRGWAEQGGGPREPTGIVVSWHGACEGSRLPKIDGGRADFGERLSSVLARFDVGDYPAVLSKNQTTGITTVDMHGDQCGWYPRFDPSIETSSLLLLFRQERFAGYRIEFPSSLFREVLSSFSSALGPPAATEKSRSQNAFGALFDVTSVLWKTKSAGVLIVSPDQKSDVASVLVSYLPLDPEQKPALPSKPPF